MDMISKSKLIHGTIAATMALSMTILPNCSKLARKKPCRRQSLTTTVG